MRPMWRLALRLLVTLILASCLVSRATMQAPLGVDANVENWLEAVRAHTPGSLDLHARAIAEWPWEVLEPVLKKAKARKDLATLLRAAVLYLDIAVHMPQEQRPAYPTGGQVLRIKDGNPLGTDTLDPHIWWGRDLVDRVIKDKNATRPDLETALNWYHATSAFLASRVELADQHWHLRFARERFPGDALLLLDAGCLAETLASPMIQHATSTFVEPDPQAPQSSRRMRPRFPGPDEYRRQAEPLFEQSIAARATAEARLRLGWVLAQRGRIDDAMPHLESAARDSDKTIRYYAWLFIGHLGSQQTKWDAAAQSYRSALELFPDAQAPHLGLSQVAAQRGATGEAREWLTRSQRHNRLLRDDMTDPWWRYNWCRGREYDSHHAQFAREIAAGAR